MPPSDVRPESTSSGLLRRAKSGVTSAWSFLVRTYAPLVLVHCHRFCRNVALPHADAEDCAQEVWLRVSQNLPEFQRRRRGSFRAWLRKITDNVLRDHASRRQLRPTDQLDQHPARPDTLPATPTDRVARALIRAKIEFSDDHWNAFERTVLHGGATRDVAADLGLSVAALRQARSRILRRLRELLSEEESADE